MIIPYVTIPILAISLFANICLMILNQWMLHAWEKDVSEKIELCKMINKSWDDKYEKLLQELEQCYDKMGDDLK